MIRRIGTLLTAGIGCAAAVRFPSRDPAASAELSRTGCSRCG